MIKNLFKQIWIERRHNGWLILELIVVFLFLLLMSDFLYVRAKNYLEPKGFDIDNTYVLKLKALSPIAPNYVAPEQITQTPTESLLSLLDRIKLYPDVEAVAISFHSAPYSMGGVWASLKVDSVITKAIRDRYVTPSYFDVFRIRTADGKPIRVQESGQNQIILTQDIAEQLYGSASAAIGRDVFFPEEGGRGTNPNRVIAVSSIMKRQEFFPYEGAFFEIITNSRLEDWSKDNDVTRVDISIRVKSGSAQHFQDNFQNEMGDRLRENNLYVASVTPSSKFREDVVGKEIRESILPMVYVVVFVLITVFLGVFGTFWLRTYQRRSEIGIRMVVGADKGKVRLHMILEGLCLMSLSIVPAFIVYINMLIGDILDVWRVPVSVERILIALVVALMVMILIIVAGILWPANRAASIQPVEALRAD